MKTLQSLVLGIMLLGGLSFSTCSKANAKNSPESAKVKAISTEIRSKVAFPAELVDKTVNEKVTVEFKIKEDSEVDVAISDEIGRRVQTILSERMPAGKYKYNTNLDRLPNGFYVLSVTTQKEILHSKIIVNK